MSLAARVVARAFPNDKALKKYLDQHPDADRSKHYVEGIQDAQDRAKGKRDKAKEKRDDDKNVKDLKKHKEDHPEGSINWNYNPKNRSKEDEAKSEKALEKEAARRVVARFKTARGNWDDKFIGKDARLQWSRQTWLLEELPQKGKKKLRSATLQNPSNFGYFDWWIPGNILQLAKLSPSDDYDKIKKKIADAYAEAVEKTEKSDRPGVKESLEKNDWVRSLVWYEEQVFYLNVIPEGTEKFTAEGKDFTISVEWTTFKTFSPGSDFQQSDPSYTAYESSSPTSARKLFSILKADPNALKNIAWNNLGDWFTKQKIQYKTNFSSWH